MITSLRLKNFRSYTDDSFEFENSVNIIIGPNTSGKTNLLEAVLVVCQGGSYRGGNEELIKAGKPWARLEATTEHDQTRIIKLMHINETPNRKYEIDGKIMRRLSMSNKIPAIVFEPNQLQQLTTSPGKRRDLVDDLLEQIEPGFGQNRRAYARALRQRNRLLKSKGNLKKLVFPWDVRLSELGGMIATARNQLLKNINRDLGRMYSSLADKQYRVDVKYFSILSINNYTSQLLTELGRNLEKDTVRGFTSIGPHRDDVGLRINNAVLQDNASRGEVRTLLLAFKMQESQIIQKKLGKKPLLLLDDVFGELDGKRRKSLVEYFKDHQTFITTTDADVIAKDYIKSVNKIALS